MKGKSLQGQRHGIFMTVYADNAATTKMSETALKALLPYMRENYGNPSSLHTVGQTAAEALFSARKKFADLLGCSPREIILLPAEAKQIIRQFYLPPQLVKKKEKSI